MKLNIYNSNFAFTLAEITVTIAILGIVAAITIPTAVRKTTEKEYVVRLAKTYAALEQALEIAVIEDGPVTSWNFKSSEGGDNKQSDIILQKLLKNLAVQKNCGYRDNSCATKSDYKNLVNASYYDNPTKSKFARAILKDGTLVFINSYSSSGNAYANLNNNELNNVCAWIKVDVNGNFKGPNKLGIDTFEFKLTTNNTLVPTGHPTEDQQENYKNKELFCNIKSKQGYNGLGCTYYALKDKNLNYLRGR